MVVAPARRCPMIWVCVCVHMRVWFCPLMELGLQGFSTTLFMIHANNTAVVWNKLALITCRWALRTQNWKQAKMEAFLLTLCPYIRLCWHQKWAPGCNQESPGSRLPASMRSRDQKVFEAEINLWRALKVHTIPGSRRLSRHWSPTFPQHMKPLCYKQGTLPVTVSSVRISCLWPG